MGLERFTLYPQSLKGKASTRLRLRTEFSIQKLQLYFPGSWGHGSHLGLCHLVDLRWTQVLQVPLGEPMPIIQQMFNEYLLCTSYCM